MLCFVTITVKLLIIGGSCRAGGHAGHPGRRLAVGLGHALNLILLLDGVAAWGRKAGQGRWRSAAAAAAGEAGWSGLGLLVTRGSGGG